MAEEKQVIQKEIQDTINKIKKEHLPGPQRDKIIKEYIELQKKDKKNDLTLSGYQPFVIGGEIIDEPELKRHGKPRLWYTTDVKQVAEIVTKNVLGHVSEDIKEVERNVSVKFKRYLTGLVLLSLATMGIGTFLSVRYIDKYSKQNTDEGKRFTKEVTNIREKYNELNNNYASLNKAVEGHSASINAISSGIEDTKKENEKRFLSLEENIKGIKESFEQDKRSTAKAMESDYGSFLQINNEMSKKMDDLTAKLSAYEKELPKIQEAGIKVSSLDEKISQFITEQGKLNTSLGELKRGLEKLEKESINKDEYNQLKKQIDGYEKTNKKLQENIDSLRKRVDSYDKERKK